MDDRNRRGRTGRLFGLVALLLAVNTSVIAAEAEPLLPSAERLVQTGRAAEAYALLIAEEDARAGEVRFDYLLGIAALDSGHADKATLAFERVLAVDPNFAGARLDMARAYYQLGDLTRARQEFDTVLTQNPPEAAQLVVARYLAMIDAAERAKRTAKSAYVEVTVGRDSNVNNSTGQSQITVPALGNLVFTLDATNVKRSDTYATVATGGDVAHELGLGYAVFAGGEVRQRLNQTADRFDSRNTSARTGLAWSDDKNVVRTTVTFDRYELDHQRNRDGTGLGADWRRTLTPALLTNAFANYNAFRFATTDLAVNDFDQFLIGAGVIRLFQDGKHVFNATLLDGYEDDKKGRADGNKNFHGLRLGGQLSLRERLDLYASLGWQRARYDKENTAFQATRGDVQRDAVIGLTWRVADRWTVRPQLLYTRNDSNIAIYAYQRTDVSVTVRRDFR